MRAVQSRRSRSWHHTHVTALSLLCEHVSAVRSHPLVVRVQSRRSKSSSGYEKKFLHLAVIRVERGETEDQAIASHGSVIINLADFTNMQQDSKKLAFRVSVNKEITAALSKIGKAEAPNLTITLTCVAQSHQHAHARSSTSLARLRTLPNLTVSAINLAHPHGQH